MGKGNSRPTFSKRAGHTRHRKEAVAAYAGYSKTRRALKRLDKIFHLVNGKNLKTQEVR